MKHTRKKAAHALRKTAYRLGLTKSQVRKQLRIAKKIGRRFNWLGKPIKSRSGDGR